MLHLLDLENPETSRCCLARLQVDDDWATVIWQKISYLGKIGLQPWCVPSSGILQSPCARAALGQCSTDRDPSCGPWPLCLVRTLHGSRLLPTLDGRQRLQITHHVQACTESIHSCGAKLLQKTQTNHMTPTSVRRYTKFCGTRCFATLPTSAPAGCNGSCGTGKVSNQLTQHACAITLHPLFSGSWKHLFPCFPTPSLLTSCKMEHLNCARSDMSGGHRIWLVAATARSLRHEAPLANPFEQIREASTVLTLTPMLCRHVPAANSVCPASAAQPSASAT